MYVLTSMPHNIVTKKDMTSYPSIWSNSSKRMKKPKQIVAIAIDLRGHKNRVI